MARRFVSLVSALTVVACTGPLAALVAPPNARAAVPTAGGWNSQHNPDSGVKQHDLSAVSCATASVCWAVGYSTLATTNGGSTWSYQTGSLDHWLFAASCPTTTTCYSAGGKGTIVKTSDGGHTWTVLHSGTTKFLYGISCPNTTTCYAAGSTGTMVATADGGKTWHSLRNPLSGSSHLWGSIVCTGPRTCLAGGWIIATTSDGGHSWAMRYDPDHVVLGVACVDASTCYAVGFKGMILHSTDSGHSWAALNSGSTATLNAVACASRQTCYVVGDNGLILTTTSDGHHWQSQHHGQLNLNGIACKGGTCYAVGDKGTILVHR